MSHCEPLYSLIDSDPMIAAVMIVLCCYQVVSPKSARFCPHLQYNTCVCRFLKLHVSSTRYRLFFENATANIAAMVDIGKQFGAKGWNIDFEPQVGASHPDPTSSSNSLLLA